MFECAGLLDNAINLYIQQINMIGPVENQSMTKTLNNLAAAFMKKGDY